MAAKGETQRTPFRNHRMNSARTFQVLAFFHFHSGARVALRSVVPLAGGLVAAGVLAGSPVIVLAPAAALFFPAEPSIGSAVLSVATFALVCKLLAHRLTRGLNGWMRHLPASGVVHRRAIIMGLLLAVLPIMLFVASSGLLSIQDRHLLSGLRIAALPVVVWASALSILEVRPGSRVLASVAGSLSYYGLPVTLLVGAGCLVVAELGAGPLRFPVAKDRRGRKATSTSRWQTSWFRITFRAFGLRYFTGPGSSIMVLVPLGLFLHNNTLSPSQESLVIKFAGLAAGIAAIAVASDLLVSRRPPWPWVRSLPFSSGSRVFLDAAILGAATVPALITAGIFNLSAVPALIAAIPFCSLRAVSAVRKAPGQAIGASGTILLEGGLTSVAIAVWPWTALMIALLTPLACRTAIRDDQRQDVSRWNELHYLAAGDSLSWGDQ